MLGLNVWLVKALKALHMNIQSGTSVTADVTDQTQCALSRKTSFQRFLMKSCFYFKKYTMVGLFRAKPKPNIFSLYLFLIYGSRLFEIFYNRKGDWGLSEPETLGTEASCSFTIRINIYDQPSHEWAESLHWAGLCTFIKWADSKYLLWPYSSMIRWPIALPVHS